MMIRFCFAGEGGSVQKLFIERRFHFITNLEGISSNGLGEGD